MLGGNFCSVGVDHGAYGTKFALYVVGICTRHSHARGKIFWACVMWIDKILKAVGLSTGLREICGKDSLLGLISRVRYERGKRGNC